MKTYIYVLKLVERLIPEENWKEKDEQIIGKHFQHLTELKEQGILLLAGKTDGQDIDTMGIVIFKAKDLDVATTIMNQDPAILEGIMTARLWEYNLALLNKEFEVK